MYARSQDPLWMAEKRKKWKIHFLSGREIAQRNSIGMWHTQMSSSLKFWICQTENTPKAISVRERQKRL